MGIILAPFAWLLLFFYNLFDSYGLALILFAIVIKLILFPVSLKTKKSMIQTTMLSGKMQQLQKQYGKDRERYNLEVQKLYAREKVNPMGGCLWSLIPMVVLIALYGIIREPLTYFMHLSTEQIALLADQLDWQTVAVANGWMSQASMEKLLEQLASGKIEHIFQNGAYNQMYLVSLINSSNIESLKAALNAQFAGAGDGLFVLNFQFLGLDLSRIPNWQFWVGGISLSAVGLFILPLVSTAVSFLSMKVSMATNRLNNNQPQNKQMESTNKMMMWMMPLMSLWIGFTVPAGLSIYWITQYLVNMIQEVICSKMLKKDYEAAREAAAKREQEEKEEEKRRKEEARLERARRLEEEKKNRGKKKPGQKKTEPEQEGVNKEDSREGIRAYARGRAYIPDRFGGVTPYVDPNEMLRAQQEAAASGKGKKKKKAADQTENKPVAEEKSNSIQAPVQKEQPVQEEETLSAAPVEENTETVEMETVEVEVEQVEVEVDEDENKEG